MKKAFTTIEALVAIAFLTVAFVLFSIQKAEIQQKMRDQQRKASINAMYFNLKEVYFKKHGAYPETLKPDSLKGVDPAIFSDPKKVLLGDPGADYTYQTSNCNNGQCKNFTLSARLEAEDTYTKSSAD